MSQAASFIWPSWMHPSVTDEQPPGNHVALAPGVLVLLRQVRRAAEMNDEDLTPPPPPPSHYIRPDWHDKALCGGDSWERYFSEDRKLRVTLANEASEVCRGCEVAPDCLMHALTEREEFGIWAGTSGLRRKGMFARIDRGETTAEIEAATWLNRLL